MRSTIPEQRDREHGPEMPSASLQLLGSALASSMWTTAAVEDRPARHAVPPRRPRNARWVAAELFGRPAMVSDKVNELAVVAEQTGVVAPRTGAVAAAAITSKTGWTSVGELAITRRISLVAVCCSSVSVTCA